MELTVLGNSSRYLVPLGAGTSYLLTHEGANLLLDCGNGTHLRLAQELGERKLDGVLVSHFHLDNVADLFPVVFSLPQGTPLMVPEGSRGRIHDLLRGYSMDRTWIANARIEGVTRESRIDVGPLTFTFAKSGHGCPGVVTRIDATNGQSVVYLGDTGPRPWLADFARDADLLVAHTLLLDREDGPSDTNLTAGAAGRLARQAGAKKLALSHIPFYKDAAESVSEAKHAFGGDVFVLKEGQKLDAKQR